MSILPYDGGGTWTALEFFAGIGLAKAGMESVGIQTVWANDNDPDKKKMYEGQWGTNSLLLADVHSIESEDVPRADVAWASSPCTDLSLAGNRAGLTDGRDSSAFFGFTRLIRGMGERKPKVLVLENVTGLASSNHREDLKAAIKEFNSLGYAVDAVALDARRFIAQSRPRLFLIGTLAPLKGGKKNSTLRPEWLAWIHEDRDLNTFITPLPAPPDDLNEGFTQEIEHLADEDPRWWDAERVDRFVQSMTLLQHERLERFVRQKKVTARTAYRRTRKGKPVWEMRAEDISGCLRTPRGGSSKQAVVVMGDGDLKIRWMTELEYARLMGAGWYHLEGLRASKVQHGFGDAVAVPVVQWVAKHMIVPHLELQLTKTQQTLHA